MSPFGGDGANLAMQDAAELALALVGDGDWGESIRGHESRMFARAALAAAGAWEGIQEAFSEDGLAHMIQQMESHRG
jgi:2-polyprenyl-6-methoxyphenol hydroxylase-like FAD-dependent oxidoreductase